MNPAPKRLLILGHGAMGHSMERLLAPHDLAIWDRDLETGEETAPLEAVATDRECVIFALPAKPHAELAERLAAVLPASAVCLSIAKGLDEAAHTPAEIFARIFAETGPRWGVIYGPMIARELQAGRPGFAVAASRWSSVFDMASDLFAASGLHLAASADVTGSSWAVILKNVYVPILGAADALSLGDNMRGFLYAEALAEMARLVATLGGEPATVYGLPGLADLVTSATSEASHHRRIGADLAAGRTDRMAASGVNIRGEGIHTLTLLQSKRPELLAQLPLAGCLLQMLDRPAQTADILDAYVRERLP